MADLDINITIIVAFVDMASVYEVNVMSIKSWLTGVLERPPFGQHP